MKLTHWIAGIAVLTSAVVYAAQDKENTELRNDYNNWKNKPAAKFTDPETNFSAVKKMLLERYYDSKLTDEALMEAATRGMLESLNPNEKEDWNKLYSPAEFKEFEVDAKGEVTGIGIEIKFNDETGIATITKVIPHSAAESSGIKTGDQVVSINGKISKGLQFRDLVYSIRGKVGESVKMKLLRGDSIVSKSVTREKINWSPIETTEAGPKVPMIKIHYFSEKSPALLKAALEKVNSSHPEGLVIDLREDEGGLFDQAVESAGFFTPKGSPIVRVDHRDGAEEVHAAPSDPIFKNVPIVILIGPKTSSGAELFAGCLSETIGAKLVGEKTHGKWSAQTLEKLSNGFAVKFTTTEFKTPNGKSYPGTGLNPDVSVTSNEQDEVVKTAYHLLEPTKR